VENVADGGWSSEVMVDHHQRKAILDAGADGRHDIYVQWAEAEHACTFLSIALSSDHNL
jgi:hypothetical protein